MAQVFATVLRVRFLFQRKKGLRPRRLECNLHYWGGGVGKLESSAILPYVAEWRVLTIALGQE